MFVRLPAHFWPAVVQEPPISQHVSSSHPEIISQQQRMAPSLLRYRDKRLAFPVPEVLRRLIGVSTESVMAHRLA